MSVVLRSHLFRISINCLGFSVLLIGQKRAPIPPALSRNSYFYPFFSLWAVKRVCRDNHRPPSPYPAGFCCRSLSAEIKRKGISAKKGLLLIVSNTSKPFIVGRRISQRIISGLFLRSMARPVAPSAATVTWYPSMLKIRAVFALKWSSSSMIRMVLSFVNLSIVVFLLGWQKKSLPLGLESAMAGRAGPRRDRRQEYHQRGSRTWTGFNNNAAMVCPDKHIN